ncbi:thioredoxin family protein [Luteolibacter arcticus]|uniref:Thioredoxin family protein n=1 Tax=Luteolibacter arcticus TaxID=1581411 RepID=A0ABT3GQT0_9BACT|nr:thioredoxin family protein [Luteolibacter arcticus]MCW1925826.1 thioredoxin family protein [Luteolibacter arcticus]
MKTKYILAATCAALAGFSSALAGGEGWSHDFDAAKKQAAGDKKDLLMDFTGSDWCGWCIKLNDEVFKHDAFKTGVKDKFVLVELDFPQDKSKLSEETQKQNEELQGKYAVQGFPTILLCDSEGKPFAKTGYQAGGPEKYVAHLDELRAKKVTRDKSFDEAAKAEGPAKAKALIAALKAMELEDETVSAFYPDVVEQIKAADPKDETGYAKELAAKEKFAAFEQELNGFARKQDHAGALAFVEKSAGDFEGEQKQQIVVTKAMIYAQMEKFDEAIKAVDEAKALAPESDMAARFDGFKKQLEAAKEKSKDKPKEGAKEEEAKEEAAE